MDEENQGRREWSGMSHMTEAEASRKIQISEPTKTR